MGGSGWWMGGVRKIFDHVLLSLHTIRSRCLHIVWYNFGDLKMKMMWNWC
jgi:hypothetical protein